MLGQKAVVATKKKRKEIRRSNYISDDYYRNYSDFVGLTKKCVIFQEREKAQETMKSVMHCMLAFLETNLVINDDTTNIFTIM